MTTADVPSHSDPTLGNNNEKSISNDTAATQANNVTKDVSPPIPFLSLFRYSNLTEKILMTIGILAAALFGSGMPLMTILFGDITQQFNQYYGTTLLFSPNDPRLLTERKILEDKIVLNIIYFVILGGATFLCSYISKATWMSSGEYQAKRIRELFLTSVLRQDMAFFDKKSPGDITTRLTADVALIQDGISEKVSLTAQYIFTFVAAFVIAFTQGWKLTLVLCSAVPLLASSGAFMAKMVGDATNKSQVSYAAAGEIAREALLFIRTVSAFGGEERLALDYERKLVGAYQVNVKKAWFSGIGLGFLMLFMFSTYSLAFWFGSTLVRTGEYSGGDVVTVFFSVIIGAFTIGNAGPNLSVIAAAGGAASQVFNIIERKPDIDTSSSAGIRVEKLQGVIEMRNVTFHYPSRPDVPVLKNFSLTVNAGETIAICGASGGGKSTIVQLIERFYDPMEGEVKVDGINIKDYHLNSYRQCIGIVEPVLFDDTIAENVALGARDGMEVTRDQIVRACELSNAAQFIAKLPEGYDTLVGERGALLSGGQKQRVAIARAIISECKILLLDESTSALDTESEKVVQAALDRASEGRTTITIAHRLSTIKKADRIVVMRNGEIAEIGPHDELLAKNGYYAELVKAQEVRTENSLQMSNTDPISVHNNHLDAAGNRVTVLDLPLDQSVHKDMKQSKSAASSVNASPEEFALSDDTNVSVLRLFRMQAPEAGIIVVGIIAAALNGAHMPLFAIIFSRILSVFGDPNKERMQKDANFWALMFLILALACFFIQLFQHSSFGIAGERLTKRVRSLSFRAMLRQNMGWFDQKENGSGALCYQLSDEADRIQGLTGVFAGQIVQLCVTMMTGLVIAFVFSWELTLLILACVPFMAGAGAIQMKVLGGGGTEIKQAYSKAAQLTNDALSNIRTVHALARQDYFFRQYKNQIVIPHSISIRKAWLGNIAAGFADGVVFWVYGAAFYALFRLVFDNGLNVGDGFTAMYAIVFSAMGSGQLSALGPNASKAKIAASGFFKLIDRVPPIDCTTQGEQRTYIQGQAAVTNVDFAYPSRPDAMILKGLTAQFPAGKKIALCGASGGGKSTVIGLLQRWYDASAGHVTIDEIDVSKWQLGNLRSHLSLVGQEPQLFSMTIFENIRFSKPDASMNEVEDAANLANIHDFINGLPEKYDTLITGAQVSGGQRQRMCIARAILRKPKLLLLDESTSALDSESEKHVQNALDIASQGRTTITIAHRLSSIQDAELILCMKDGVVAESGTHDELYAKNGIYTQLVNHQKLGEN